MLCVNTADDSMILAPGEGAAAEIFNPGGTSKVCLVCEHASAFIPSSLDNLGLADKDRFSHAVWDIGAMKLALDMVERLDALLVASRVSRLVYDCNRPPEATDATPEKTEFVEVPGNRNLSDIERERRTAEIYVPFCETLRDALQTWSVPPALVTIHSFAPTWLGKAREVELGLLHDADDRLARRMLAHADPSVKTRLNEPYSAKDGVTHTLKEHGLPHGIENVMIEVRNDLLSDEEGVTRMSKILCNMLAKAFLSKGGDLE